MPVSTLRWWRHKGIGPRSFKMGRHVVYQRSDLDAWIDAQRGEVALAAHPDDTHRSSAYRYM